MASEVKEESNSTPSDTKNDETVEEVKNADNELKAKDSVKNEKKEESAKVASEDDDNDDEEDEEGEVALLDRPLEVVGSRARKKVERLEVSFTIPKEKYKIPEGKGKKLGDCPRIEAQITKMKLPDLKPLHKVLFNRAGSANEIKKNIRKFSGFTFEKDSVEFTRRRASMEKLTAPILKNICTILDIERGGTKEDLVNRLMSFLLNPEDSGKAVPIAKKKASKDKKKGAGKKVKPDKKAKDKNESEEEHEEEEDEEDEEDQSSMGGTDEEAEGLLVGSDYDEEEEDEDDSQQKSKDSKNTKTNTKVEKTKKEEKKTKGAKRKQGDNSSASSEDEPPAKKSKMPSDEEISKLVKQILESADLQEITMKKVIKQVSDAYPDFDLSHKKGFIKSTIKSVIS